LGRLQGDSALVQFRTEAVAMETLVGARYIELHLSDPQVLPAEHWDNAVIDTERDHGPMPPSWLEYDRFRWSGDRGAVGRHFTDARWRLECELILIESVTAVLNRYDPLAVNRLPMSDSLWTAAVDHIREAQRATRGASWRRQ
jgi:hypothetical protein